MWLHIYHILEIIWVSITNFSLNRVGDFMKKYEEDKWSDVRAHLEVQENAEGFFLEGNIEKKM